MIKRFLDLKENPIVREVYTASKEAGVDAYLVGGVVRNLSLSFPIGCDYDIALSGDVERVTNLFASRVGGSPFPLDRETGFFRVVVKGRESSQFGVRSSELKSQISNLKSQIYVDFSPFKGKDILEDLGFRDFTINAMALNLNHLFKGEVSILDPFGGLEDGKNRIIRVVGQNTFRDDPVRLLRAVRFASQYSFTVEDVTAGAIKADAQLLSHSSWERIRDEFLILLSQARTSQYLELLYKLGLLKEVITEVGGWEDIGGYDLLYHTLKTVEEVDALLSDISGFLPELSMPLLEHLQETIGSIPRVGLLRLAAFLHDVGKPLTMKVEGERLRFIGHEVEGEDIGKRISKRLKLSKKAIAIVTRLIRNHHRVFALASLEKVSQRSKAHLFRSVGGEDGLELLLIALADARATRGGDDPELASLVKELISFYYAVYTVHRPPPLLNGHEVMDILDIPEGVMVGRVLKKLAEAEAGGVVKDKKEAVSFIKTLYFVSDSH
ncbi:MAG: CCA tRNA nucleotidyltransferase [Deltaproteobacteria bacterium]|nr:CCA tRNA nucleotidyltransferase [Deltaproteobacteria bacterium]